MPSLGVSLGLEPGSPESIIRAADDPIDPVQMKLTGDSCTAAFFRAPKNV